MPISHDALLVDLYELTMMEAYLRDGISGPATFDLFVRDLPRERNFLLTAGLGPLLETLECLRFTSEDISYLASTGMFSATFLELLAGFRFTGDVDAMAEGSLAFAGEPFLRLTAPVVQAQLLETLVMNQMHLATTLASKAARVVVAARGRKLADFGLRRTHGAEAGTSGARAYWIAGFGSTSNVLAGKLYGMPISGTMAHSYVQLHEDEGEAFRSFARVFPETVLLVDTYDTLRGVDLVIELARELGEGFAVQGVRLDSGDLASLARRTRDKLDQAGLERVQIFASGNLDEWRVRDLVAGGAPIDAFGVGTRLGTSQDAPNLDIVYKLAQYEERPLLKLSTDKATLPGVKQVWRRSDGDGRFTGDTIGLAGEELPGEPLLRPVMRGGRRLPGASEDLDTIRARARHALDALAARVRALEPADPPYEVRISHALWSLRERLVEELR